MRKIEEKMKSAFNGRYDWRESNTEVKTNVRLWSNKKGGCIVCPVVAYLHGNAIACVDDEGRTHYSCAGWHTPTTASRLRALGADVRIKNFTMIFDSGEVVPDRFRF